MKLMVYNEVIETVHSFHGRIKMCHLAKIFPSISLKTLGSIYSQDYQRKMKKVHHIHYSTSKVDEYYSRFFEEVGKGNTKILLHMADEIDMSPALLARLILERYLSTTFYEGESPPRGQLTQIMKDTTQIQQPDLANEVLQCVLADDIYGPVVDSVKHSIGHEYEFLLEKLIEESGLSYLGEEQLRSKGYDKTPDFKLEVPIAVDGYIVNWIESKASFGDEASHKGYLKEQFWSYWNRFGPGLVIYWFGFIDELDSNREKGILLMDHFPKDITLMNPAALDPNGEK